MFFGRSWITGEQFEATSASSGVKAKLGLEPKLWGTQVALELSNVRGPLKCQLVAISRNGQNDTAMTWTVTPRVWPRLSCRTSAWISTTSSRPYRSRARTCSPRMVWPARVRSMSSRRLPLPPSGSIDCGSGDPVLS